MKRRIPLALSLSALAATAVLTTAASAGVAEASTPPWRVNTIYSGTAHISLQGRTGSGPILMVVFPGTGRNPFGFNAATNTIDFCLILGSPYLQPQPAALFAETAGPLCDGDRISFPPRHTYASVSGNATTGVVNVSWFNELPYATLFGGGCTRIYDGSTNPNFFERIDSLIGFMETPTCSGFGKLTFTADGGVTGTISQSGHTVSSSLLQAGSFVTEALSITAQALPRAAARGMAVTH